MRPLLSFYGDDFTGTVATAELLSNLGISTVVFPSPPSKKHIEKCFPEVEAIGIAGMARAWSLEEMDRRLPSILGTIKTYGAPVFLYKVSSTFDSSPDTGSIGRAIEIGRAVYRTGLVPVMPAAPGMGRMTVFGNHYAGGEDGRIHRLDRLQAMANHPVTPMGEADLLRHLAKQTHLASGLVDVRVLEGGTMDVERRIKHLENKGVSIALFDALFDRHLAVTCETLWKLADSRTPLFVVGSHELGEGLGRVIRDAGVIAPTVAKQLAESATDPGPLLAVSGSCSTTTRSQILDAIESGFFGIAFDVDTISDPTKRLREERRTIAICRDRIAAGQSVVVHTCMGTNDPRIDEHNLRSRNSREFNEALGGALGRIASDVLRHSGVRRVAVAGGDTSGRVLAHLRVEALVLDPAMSGRYPICCVHSDDPEMDGIEVALKGGQVGGARYFSDVRDIRSVGLGDVDLDKDARGV